MQYIRQTDGAGGRDGRTDGQTGNVKVLHSIIIGGCKAEQGRAGIGLIVVELDIDPLVCCPSIDERDIYARDTNWTSLLFPDGRTDGLMPDSHLLIKKKRPREDRRTRHDTRIT